MAAAAEAAREGGEEDRGRGRRAVEMDAAVRREMAIRRLQEEAEAAGEAGRGRSRREFAVFETARGDALFTQSWTPAAADRVKGIVVLLHGLNEHSGRYNHFAKLLNDQGLKVYAMDWIERISRGCCVGGKLWFAMFLIWPLHRWSCCFEGSTRSLCRSSYRRCGLDLTSYSCSTVSSDYQSCCANLLCASSKIPSWCFA